MKINLYAKDNGYLDVESILKAKQKIIFCVGARGIGKSYSSIKFMLEHKKKFVYLRRTQSESDLQANPMTSSLTKNLNDMDIEYTFKKISNKVGCIFIGEEPMIYTCALSTFASIRGINFDMIDYIIFDEFIKEPHVKSIKSEGIALLNLYESINRNRVIDKKEEITLLCLANSMDIANDTFMQFDLVTIAENMIEKGQEIYINGDILLLIPQNSPISKAKEKGVLYRNAGEEYSAMAIKNEFILNDFTYIQKRNLRDYRILLNVGDLYLYKHKALKEYYVTFSKADTKRKYTTSTADLERFRRAEWRFYNKYLDGYVKFESYKACALFEKYFDK